MVILGREGSWYRNKFVDYKYYLSQGEMIFGEIESLITSGGIGGIIVLMVERYSGWLMPWQMVIVLVLALRVLKVFVGRLDKKYLKLGQAMAEYGQRKQINLFEMEKMERLKNVEKKVAPETYKEKYKSYLFDNKDEQ